MTDRITPLHRALLWASLLLLAALGTVFLFAPDVLMDQLGIAGSDRANGVFRVASSFLLAEAVMVAVALRSGSCSETRYFSYLLGVHFALETVIRIATFAMDESGSLTAAIPQVLIAAGLAIEIARRRQSSTELPST